jgi:hypothetical protein
MDSTLYMLVLTAIVTIPVRQAPFETQNIEPNTGLLETLGGLICWVSPRRSVAFNGDAKGTCVRTGPTDPSHQSTLTSSVDVSHVNARIRLQIRRLMVNRTTQCVP